MKKSASKESFVGETIQPVAGTFDVSGMAAGKPGLPQEFLWRKKLYKVEKLLREWRDTGPCTHGSDERYVRKHWFELVTTSGETMTLYFERKPRRGAIKRDWRIFTIST